MLTSYLKSGQTVDFAVATGKSNTLRYIEMLLTGADLQKIETIKLTPLEALTISDHFRQMAEYLHTSGYDYTESTQEEEPLLMEGENHEVQHTTSDTNVAIGVSRRQQGEGAHRRTGRIESDTTSTSNLDHGGGEDMRGTQQGNSGTASPETGTDSYGSEGNAAGVDAQAEAPITDLHPRAEQLLAGAGVPIPPVDMPNPLTTLAELTSGVPHSVPLVVTSEGKVAREQLPPPPQVINVEIDDMWVAHVSLEEGNDNQAGEAEADTWQSELDSFVDALQIRVGKYGKRSANFTIVSPSISDADDETIMPLLVTAHPWLRSKAMQLLILEVFAQAFRFGASWENINGGERE